MQEQANQDMCCIGAQFVHIVQRNAPDDSDGSIAGDWGTDNESGCESSDSGEEDNTSAGSDSDSEEFEQ